MKKHIIFWAAALLGISTLSAVSVSTAAEPTQIYTKQDVQNLRDYLLTKSTETADKSYDLNADGVWNVTDLTLIKQEMLHQADTSDILVAYFSQTGNTEKIADYIVEITGADRYVIEAAIPYTDADIQYSNADCRANQEQDDPTVRPEIAAPLDNIDAYDVVFLGYPIWWGEEPRIIDTFLESYDFSEKTVIPFCTSGSSGIAVSEENIKNLVEIGDLQNSRRFPASASYDDVSTWIDTLPITNQKEESRLNIAVNGHTLTATLANNAAAQALAELLKDAPMELHLNEYGSFEKVGALPQSLPKSDERITTEPGDIMLYQGCQITIFYGANTWSYTPLGKIDNATQTELKSILGDGNVTVTLSLES